MSHFVTRIEVNRNIGRTIGDSYQCVRLLNFTWMYSFELFSFTECFYTPHIPFAGRGVTTCPDKYWFKFVSPRIAKFNCYQSFDKIKNSFSPSPKLKIFYVVTKHMYSITNQCLSLLLLDAMNYKIFYAADFKMTLAFFQMERVDQEILVLKFWR